MHSEITSLGSSLVERSREGFFSADFNVGAQTAPRFGLAIRGATPADAAAIARIHVETWRSAYRDIIPSAHLDSLSVERRTQGWEKNLLENRDRVLVAEVAGVVVGWVSFGSCRDEGEKHQAEIYALYVDASRQRTGIGGALLWVAEREISAARIVTPTRISLWVLARNDAARRFYERMGYVVGSRKKDELIGGEPFTELRYEKAMARRASSMR